MAYRWLEIGDAPPRVRRFVQHIEAAFFHDVHAMLRLPLPQLGIDAQQSFAILQTLAAAISGISVVLYKRAGESGELFKSVLEEYFPWEMEPDCNVKAKAAANIIYDVFRNPLAHYSGLQMVRSSGKRQLAARRYQVVVKRRIGRSGSGHSEEWIEELEKAIQRPSMGPTLRSESTKKVLLVEGLYWGTRQLILRLLADGTRAAKAERFLSEM